MRGRIASFAIGAGMARRRTEAAMGQQAQQAEAQQREIEQLKAAQAQPSRPPQPQQSSNQEDVTQKLQKLADLKAQGVLTDEEFQKLKSALIAKL